MIWQCTTLCSSGPRLLILVAAWLVTASLAFGQPLAMSYTATYSEDDLAFGTLAGYDTVRLAEAGYLNDPGRPLVPAQTLRIAVPGDMTVTGVRVLATEAVELPGEYWLYPGQPPRRISDRSPGVFVEPDPQTYSSDQAYPGELVRLGHQADLAGQAMAVIEVYPLQYVPAEKKLVLHTSIDLVLEGEPGYVCGDYLPVGLSPERQAVWEQRVAELVVNPEDVVLQAGEVAVGSRGVPPGTYDYVIITTSAWASGWQSLADWKTRKGVPAKVVTTSWIYNEGGYSGTNVEKIRAFVQDAHANWGTLYVLLGGDTDTIPAHWRSMYIPNYGWEDIPNDTYYGDYDNDWVYEVYVGRAPVRNATQVNTFINKVFTYEKSPPLTNYAKTAFFMGFDLYSYGSGEGENLKKAIKNLYLPASWTYSSEYDSEPGYHKNDCIAYLNQGHHLVNHSDHAYSTAMGVGSTNHNQYLYNSDMTALYNGTRQSILYSLGCWACDYNHSPECIAEAFVKDTNGGGVAFIGNSRYGWYIPYTDDYLSARYDRYFFRSLFHQGHTTLGRCFADHKEDAYENDYTMKYIFVELTLLGDPELPIWTENPMSLDVVHDPTLEVGQYTDFPVQVSSGGNPVAGAKVCLWKGDDVYKIAQTNASGVATFWFAPLSGGTMYVTVGKHNYVPYVGQADVTEGAGPYNLTIEIVGEGSVEVDPPNGPYDAGTEVTLTAQAAEYWVFDHWEGSIPSEENPITIVMNGHRLMIAVFEPDCNQNGQADWKDIAQCPPDDPDCQDCNKNGIPDWCDIHVYGTSEDCQPNGIPDECDIMPPAYVEAADLCADAQPVRPGVTYFGTTHGHGVDGSASCGYSNNTPDVWYRYKPAGNGQATISLLGSSFDTVLSVHSGCPGTPANELACNDDYYASPQSRLQMGVIAGNIYYIRISGNSETGAFEMTLTGPAAGTEGDENGNGIPDECENGCGDQKLGDANCDGVVDGFDIQPFVLALTDPNAWIAAYPDCDILCVCDCNCDGTVDGFDIQPFVECLTSGCDPCP